MKIILFSVITVAMFGLVISSVSAQEQVPSWVKNTAGWWATDAISETEFVNAIEFLINQQIIHVSTHSLTGQSENVPSWVKNTAGWWATDAISETEFVNAIEFLIQNNIIVIESDVSSLLLTWDEIVNDAKYANQGSLLIRDKYTNQFNLGVHFDAHSEAFIDMTTFDLLHSGISLFEITGDEKYLDQARDVADTIEQNLLLDDGQVFGYQPKAEQFFQAHNRYVLDDIVHLALYDSSYKKLTHSIADGILNNEINHQTNLIYRNNSPSGNPTSLIMDMSYEGSAALECLLLAYEVTNEKKYLEQVKQTILSYWELRNPETNLIPSSINVDDLSVEKEFMQQYGAGIFLKILLHYYYLTDDPEIFGIMKTYHDAVIQNFWGDGTWHYRVNFDGSVKSDQLEANYAKLDDVLILLSDLDPLTFDTSFDYAKIDYDKSFQSKIAVANDLVIHSVQTGDILGEKASRQSLMQYAFIINQNVGTRLFSDTNDTEYLKSLKEFYHSIILNHKRDLGYAFGIDAYTLDDTELGHLLNQRASGMIANKIILTFVPTDGVKIIWTKIGSHEITEQFITTFHDSGRFNQIEFNYEDKSILLHAVYNSGKIIFADEIESVLVDGDDYSNFHSHILNTLDGNHSYHVFLK